MPGVGPCVSGADFRIVHNFVVECLSPFGEKLALLVFRGVVVPFWMVSIEIAAEHVGPRKVQVEDFVRELFEGSGGIVSEATEFALSLHVTTTEHRSITFSPRAESGFTWKV